MANVRTRVTTTVNPQSHHSRPSTFRKEGRAHEKFLAGWEEGAILTTPGSMCTEPPPRIRIENRSALGNETSGFVPHRRSSVRLPARRDSAFERPKVVSFYRYGWSQ